MRLYLGQLQDSFLVPPSPAAHEPDLEQGRGAELHEDSDADEDEGDASGATAAPEDAARRCSMAGIEYRPAVREDGVCLYQDGEAGASQCLGGS